MLGEVKKYIVIATLCVASQSLEASMPTFEDDDVMMREAEQVVAPEVAQRADQMPTLGDEEQTQMHAEPAPEVPMTKEAYVEMPPVEAQPMDVADEQVPAEQPQDDQDDSGLSGGEIAGIAAGAAAGAAALGAAAMMGKSAYSRRRASAPEAAASRTQIPTPPVGHEYTRAYQESPEGRGIPAPAVAPRRQQESTLDRLKRQGAVSVSPLNVDKRATAPARMQMGGSISGLDDAPAVTPRTSLPPSNRAYQPAEGTPAPAVTPRTSLERTNRAYQPAAETPAPAVTPRTSLERTNRAYIPTAPPKPSSARRVGRRVMFQ